MVGGALATLAHKLEVHSSADVWKAEDAEQAD
jgi:hypothetical protein